MFSWSNALHATSYPKPPHSSASIELERLYAMPRNARHSTLTYSNSSSYNLGSQQNPKCVMEGPHSNFGYSRMAKIFRNVEAMQVKESVAKEKDAVSKARYAIVGVGVWDIGKMILGRTIQGMCGVSMLFNLNAIRCIFYLQ